MAGECTDSPSRPHHLLIWMTGLSIAAILFFHDFAQLDGVRLSVSKLVVGRDFLNVWSGGRLLLSGQLPLIYDYQGYMDWQAALFGPLDGYNYSYPPHSLFLAAPFALCPYPVALLLWTVAGAGFFLWAARPYMPASLHPFYAILTPAALVNIWAGHYGFVIGGLWLLFFSALGQHPRRSGILAGLLTVKPHLGLLIALTLVARRHYRAVVTALCVTAFLILASGLAFGFELWPRWIFDVSALQTQIMTASGQRFYHLMMPSAFVALRDLSTAVAFTVQALVAVIALGLFWQARHAAYRDLAFIAASTTAIVMPYIFNYDLTVASLGFAICLYAHWPALRRWEKLSLWLGFATPVLVMMNNYLGPIGLLAGLWVQLRHAGLSPAPDEKRLSTCFLTPATGRAGR